jgi:hypothetical protein
MNFNSTSCSADAFRTFGFGVPVFICDECVQVCNDIMADAARFSERRSRAGHPHAIVEVKEGAEPKQFPRVPVSAPTVRCELCRMPAPIEDGILIPNRGVLCPGCIVKSKRRSLRAGSPVREADWDVFDIDRLSCSNHHDKTWVALRARLYSSRVRPRSLTGRWSRRAQNQGACRSGAAPRLSLDGHESLCQSAIFWCLY